MNEREYDAEFRNQIDKFPIGEQVKMADDALSKMKAYLYLFLETMGRLSYALEVMTDEERKTYDELEKEHLAIRAHPFEGGCFCPYSMGRDARVHLRRQGGESCSWGKSLSALPTAAP